MESLSGGTMGISKDPQTPSDFDRYRKDRKLRRSQQKVTAARGDRVQRDMIRQIEERERDDAREQRISREMYEFVEETTRLAATILKELSAQYQQNRSSQISQEMKDFFSETLRRAESLTEQLRQDGQDAGSLQLAVAEMEPLLENLPTELLDEFRAEGTLEGQRHMGQHPVDHARPSTSKEAAAAPGNSEISASSGSKTEEESADADGCFDLEPLASDEFLDDEVPSEASTLQDPLKWRPNAGSPLEAPEAQPGDEVDVDSGTAEESADEAPPFEEDEPEGPGLPLGLDGVAHDPAKLKKALTLMVQNGLLSKADANSAWQQAREFARSRPASS